MCLPVEIWSSASAPVPTTGFHVKKVRCSAHVSLVLKKRTSQPCNLLSSRPPGRPKTGPKTLPGQPTPPLNVSQPLPQPLLPAEWSLRDRSNGSLRDHGHLGIHAHLGITFTVHLGIGGMISTPAQLLQTSLLFYRITK